jgi:hypothetical protein
MISPLLRSTVDFQPSQSLAKKKKDLETRDAVPSVAGIHFLGIVALAN